MYWCICVVKFEMLTVHGNNIHFRLTNGCSYVSVEVFEAENVSTWGGLEPPNFGFMPNVTTTVTPSNVFVYKTYYMCLCAYIINCGISDTLKINNITMTSHKRCDVWNFQQPNRLFNSLFKIHITGPFLGESIVDMWIPFTKG